jgi:hypothetical protein
MSMLSRFATTGGGGDPYWNSVSYLLVGNGANGTTANIKDSSSNNLTTTVSGSTVISTAQSKFNTGSSVYFPGVSNYLTVTSSSVLALPGEFTVEMWVYFTAAANFSAFFSVLSGFQIGLNSLGYLATAQQGVAIEVSSTTAVPLNSWHYVAVTRNASNLVTIYLDTSSVATGTYSTNYSAGTAYINYNSALPTAGFTGYVYDLRVTKGVCRYTGSTITNPTAPFPTYGP